MKFHFRSVVALCLASAVLPTLASAQHFAEKILVSNLSLPNNSDGTPVIQDKNFLNTWGITRSGTSPWWINNNNSGTSSLYGFVNNVFGPINIFDNKTTNFVVVPPPGFEPGVTAAPTGIVWNGNANDFLLQGPGTAAAFIFVTEDGTISGWNPGVNATPGVPGPSTNALRVVDNSDNGSPNSSVYKGATLGVIDGETVLYVTNFRHGKVEVYNSGFKPVYLGEDAFDDDSLPPGFAPFNIQNIGGELFVTYAKQDAARHDEATAPGLGFVNIFTPKGRKIGHLQHGPWMNAPWGVVWTPRDFGRFGNSILVGQFGSGWIAAFNGFTHEFLGFLQQEKTDDLITIDGLWSLTFGNDATAGPATTLFFTAGPNSETNGLFGTLTPAKGEEDGSIE